LDDAKVNPHTGRGDQPEGGALFEMLESRIRIKRGMAMLNADKRRGLAEAL
jgi:hypothetical protein